MKPILKSLLISCILGSSFSYGSDLTSPAPSDSTVVSATTTATYPAATTAGAGGNEPVHRTRDLSDAITRIARFSDMKTVKELSALSMVYNPRLAPLQTSARRIFDSELFQRLFLGATVTQDDLVDVQCRYGISPDILFDSPQSFATPDLLKASQLKRGKVRFNLLVKLFQDGLDRVPPDYSAELMNSAISTTPEFDYRQKETLKGLLPDADPEDLFNTGVNLAGNFAQRDAGMKAYKRALAHPHITNYHALRIASDLQHFGEREEAIRICHRILQAPDVTPNDVIYAASILKNSGLIEEAAAAASRALTSPDLHYNNIMNAAQFLYLNHQYDAALQACNRALAHPDLRADCIVAAATFLKDLGHRDAAIEALNRAVDRPDFLALERVLLSAAKNFNELGHKETAVQLCTRMLSNNKTPTLWLSYLAQLLYQLGEHQLAEQACQRILTNLGDLPIDNLLKLADLLRDLGQTDNAISVLNYVLEQPDSWDTVGGKIVNTREGKLQAKAMLEALTASSASSGSTS